MSQNKTQDLDQDMQTPPPPVVPLLTSQQPHVPPSLELGAVHFDRNTLALLAHITALFVQEMKWSMTMELCHFSNGPAAQ